MSLGLPVELGGASADEKTINPEQLFACAWAASLADAIGFVAKQRNQILHEVSVTAAVSLVQYEADGFGVEAEFEISMPEVSESVAAELVTEARTACPYAKAWRGGQNFKLTILRANGE